MAKDLLPLRHGYYVLTNIKCGDASNYSLMSVWGPELGEGETECRNYSSVELSKTSFRVSSTCRDVEGQGGPWQTSIATYTVPNPTSFSFDASGMHFAYRYCPQKELPWPWSSDAPVK